MKRLGHGRGVRYILRRERSSASAEDARSSARHDAECRAGKSATKRNVSEAVNAASLSVRWEPPRGRAHVAHRWLAPCPDCPDMDEPRSHADETVVRAQRPRYAQAAIAGSSGPAPRTRESVGHPLPGRDWRPSCGPDRRQVAARRGGPGQVDLGQEERRARVRKPRLLDARASTVFVRRLAPSIASGYKAVTPFSQRADFARRGPGTTDIQSGARRRLDSRLQSPEVVIDRLRSIVSGGVVDGSASQR